MSTAQPQTASSKDKDSKANGADKKAATTPATTPASAAAKDDKATSTPAAAATTPAESTPAEGAAAEEVKERQKVYIVTGEVREFKNASEAEKFLNKDPAAPKDFTVIKGKKVEKKAKVSLR